MKKAKSNKILVKGKKKVKFVSMLRWQVKKQATKRNWLDIPSDVMANILSRIGVFDIIENAQKVCTTWRRICKEPSMWRVVSMANPSLADPIRKRVCQEICKDVVDRSQGQMVDISMTEFCNHRLLRYIADRSSQLRRLVVKFSSLDLNGVWSGCLKKFSLLEELSLYTTQISVKGIEAAGRYCPLLKTLKVNHHAHRDYACAYTSNDRGLAVAIGKNLPELRHLELIGSTMMNMELKAILDGCRHLESLDLRQCLSIKLEGDLGKRCQEQIKHLKLPLDSLEDYQPRNKYVDQPRDHVYPVFFDDYAYKLNDIELAVFHGHERVISNLKKGVAVDFQNNRLFGFGRKVEFGNHYSADGCPIQGM